MVKILLVEDDLNTQFMMAELLETLGYACKTVSSGEDCLGLLIERPRDFDLVLMDIHMPGMTGLDVSRKIRSIDSDPARKIPIVAVTGDTRYHAAQDLGTAGIDAVLQKPIDMSALDNVILRHAA